MSWASGREKSGSKKTFDEKCRAIIAINALLKQLAENEDFQNDLKLPIVQRAINHWYNAKI